MRPIALAALQAAEWERGCTAHAETQQVSRQHLASLICSSCQAAAANSVYHSLQFSVCQPAVKPLAQQSTLKDVCNNLPKFDRLCSGCSG
jgi:hypothetical protein